MLKRNSLEQAALVLEVKGVSELGFSRVNEFLDQATSSLQDSIDRMCQKVTERATTSQTNIFMTHTESSMPVLQVLQEASQATRRVRDCIQSLSPCTNIPNQIRDYSLTAQDCIYRLNSIQRTMSQKLDELKMSRSTTGRDKIQEASAVDAIRMLLKEHERNAAGLQQAFDQLPIQESPEFSPTLSLSPTSAWSEQVADVNTVYSTSQVNNDKVSSSGRLEHSQVLSTLPHDPEEALVQIQATLSRLCPKTCKCDCHKLRRMRTPGFAAGIIGKFLISYNSFAVWNPRTCSHPSCLNHSATAIRLNYIFPQWIIHRALAFSISWSSGITGHGATMYLNIPRVLPESHDVWKAIDNNNVSRLQYLLKQKEVTPTDVSERGENFLLVETISCSFPCTLANNEGRRRYDIINAGQWPNSFSACLTTPRILMIRAGECDFSAPAGQL